MELRLLPMLLLMLPKLLRSAKKHEQFAQAAVDPGGSGGSGALEEDKSIAFGKADAPTPALTLRVSFRNKYRILDDSYGR